jgi:2-polyprenyl-6-methoxyphenol hydroxylase-like FAD-dependent oxidoreductase
LRALVIGGGIGGLAAAVALRRAGHEVTVFEQAPEFREVGAGLGVSANALKALDALGLREHASARGAMARRLLLRASSGLVLSDFRLEAGQESLGIHRAALLAILAAAAGEETVELGMRCTGVAQDPFGVTATFADGSSARGDFLIGADGINSVTRASILGASKPRYAGYAGWRAVAPVGPALRSPEVFWETWGRGLRFGCVDIGDGRVYWFVAETAPEAAAAPPTDGTTARLRRLLAGWHEPIDAIVASTTDDAVSRTPIYDRKPTRRWGRGRLTLLGDAAHAMTPNLGQGASQALEDAAVLGRVAQEVTDVVVMLRLYEQRRVKRANTIVRRSRQVGRFGQARNPLVCIARDRLMRVTPNRVQKAQQEKVLAFDAGSR